jgi:O-antigen/teichoic acid export membrane protein
MDTELLPDQAGSEGHAERFFVNVIWTWLAVGASFFSGFFLSRYVIRGLGEARYGIWALTFSLVESFSLFDLGFRTAVVNFTSRLRARGEPEAINQVINTSLAYFLAIATVIAVLTVALGGQAHRLFKIQEAYRADFSILIRIVGISWSAGMVFSVFQAGLEAFQRFKLFYRISVSMLLIRAVGCVLLVRSGYGLVAMGYVVLVTYLTGYVLTLLLFFRVFRPLRLSPSLFRYSLWKEMAGYGAHSFLANSASMLLLQGPPLMVGHFLSDAFVGFYTLPSRLFQYAVEMVTRIGFVTAPNTAELLALGRSEQVIKLGMYLNRYCFALFLPFSVFLMTFGRELIHLWVGDRFAVYAAPLLLPFTLSTSFAVAGQFNSSSILFGMAKHNNYARSLVLECALLMLGLAMVIPRYGIEGAAWLTAVLMLLNRGVLTAYMLCRNLNYSFLRYMQGIYFRFLLGAVPVIGAAFCIKHHWISGRTWTELFLMLGLICCLFYGAAAVLCIEPDHYLLVRGWILRRIRVRPASA